MAPAGTVVLLGCIATIADSIFGKPDPDTWRPLPTWTLFSEGWNEAWVPSPNASRGAPRRGWINAADGNLYRLWFFTTTKRRPGTWCRRQKMLISWSLLDSRGRAG
jgi:hypothetical protein